MGVKVEKIRLATAALQPVKDVAAEVHRPDKPREPYVFLAHGAGNDLHGAALVALAAGIAERGHLVVRFNLPYREIGNRRPPQAAKSIDPYWASFKDAVRRLGPKARWVAGGKSYGGRVASLAAAQGMLASGLLFYGYPLHAPGKSDDPRVEHWPRIEVPCLFLQGTKDPLCDSEKLRGSLKKLGGMPTLQVVEGGDHSLAVSARDARDGVRRTEPEVLESLVPTVVEWLARVK